MWRRFCSIGVAVGLVLAGLAALGPIPAEASATPAGGILIQVCGTLDLLTLDECELNVADASHLGVHEVGDLTLSPAEMRRSPVSNTLAAVGYAGGAVQLVVLDADGTVLHAVDASPGAHLEAAISWDPSGAYVVYAEQDGTEARLMLLDVTSGSTSELGSWPSTTGEAAVHAIDWSPDGSTIALSGGHDSDTPVGLWTVDVATGAVTQRVADLVGGVRWSPDGGEIGYAVCRLPGVSSVHELRVQDATFAAPADVLQTYTAHDERCLPTGSPAGWGDDPVNNEVAWHPEGDRLAAWSRDSAAIPELRVIDRSGSVLAATEVTAIGQLAWAPDGSGLLYVELVALFWLTAPLAGSLHVLPADLGTGEELIPLKLVDGLAFQMGAVWALAGSLPPHAVPDAFRVSPGGTLAIGAPGVLGNDLTFGSPAAASLLSGPAGLGIAGNGAVSFAAPATEGAYAFDYETTTASGSSSAGGTVHVDEPPPFDVTVTACPDAFGEPLDDMCEVTVEDLQTGSSTPLFAGPALPTHWNGDRTRVITGDVTSVDPESLTWDLVVRDSSMAEIARIESVVFGAPWYDVWAADGEHFAYVETAGESTFAIHTARFDGTDDQVVATLPVAADGGTDLAWSPQDADRLFVRIGSTLRVYDGTGLTAEITFDAYELGGFAPSPVDADVFAYTKNVVVDGTTKLQILLRDISAGSDTLLAEFSANFSFSSDAPAWSPDGETLALAAVDEGTYNPGIWLIDVDAATKTLWREMPGTYMEVGVVSPEFSPDGSSLGWTEWMGFTGTQGPTSTLRVQELDAAMPITLVEDAPGQLMFAWGGPAVPPAPRDHLRLSISGGQGYAADADLTGGNLRVAKDRSGVVSVTGSGTYPGINAATASVSVSVNRFWILPLWLGNVRVTDGSYRFDGLMLFPSVSPTQAGAAVTGTWLQLSTFPWGMGSLSMNVADQS